MKTILEKIIANKIKEVALLRSKYNYAYFEKSDLFSKPSLSLKDRIREKDFGIIAEIKRKSPSVGVIDVGLDILLRSRIYEESGVAGISCLTDLDFFGGSISDLHTLKKNTNTPILRKEFIIDELQIFESKANGADAILLIAEVLDKAKIIQFTIMAQSLGMEVILELNSVNELSKINDLVDIIGVNNRDLHRQQTDINRSFELIRFLPKEKLLISESGISSKKDIISLTNAGFNGALIGESILKSENPVSLLKSFHSKKEPIC